MTWYPDALAPGWPPEPHRGTDLVRGDHVRDLSGSRSDGQGQTGVVIGYKRGGRVVVKWTTLDETTVQADTLRKIS